jgi:D-hexose-6-phosphate mutarotase
MSLPDLNRLNKHFGAAGRIAVRAGNGGLPVVTLAGPHGACEVSLYGGQVLSYKPQGHAPVLFVSRKASYEAGKPIRGGIPVCWPWFGPHTDRGKPAHGFARLRTWTLQTAEYSAQMTDVKLGLCDDEHTRTLWPHAFELTLRVVLDATLRVELTVHNRDKTSVMVSEALHTYLRVRDVSRVSVYGLEGVRYFDALTGREHPAQKAPIAIAGETDRIYHDTGAECRVDDPGLGRQIVVAKRNSHATVVWNPWCEKAKRLPDFGADEYPQMLCVETANCHAAAMTLPPGEVHTMSLSLRADLKSL